ncbi:TPA: hypothetical protein NY097_004655 [Escherichia coli]|nr:hypothetical protein [Escherichia coli]
MGVQKFVFKNVPPDHAPQGFTKGADCRHQRGFFLKSLFGVRPVRTDYSGNFTKEQRTKQALADLVEALKEEEKPFDLPDIPDFPDDFNIDDMNQLWEEMNKR